MDPSELEIVSTRFVNAPRNHVFDAFADPRQLAEWWGPYGFTNTITEFDLQPGGKWRLVMRSPDGVDYVNLSEFVEVVRPERIEFLHLDPVHRFRMTMAFVDRGGKTELTWRMSFEDAAEFEKVKGFIVPANEQNFDRLELFLTSRIA